MKRLGLRVVNAGSSYNGVYLGDPAYAAFWAAVNELGPTVWIHPEGVRDPWFQRYALWNSAGQSIEETKAMASSIYEGVMHRYPDLKVVIAHGGGYFPHYLGRMDRNHANRPDTVRNTGGKRPSEFLRSFHYDTCVYDPQVLKVLLSASVPIAWSWAATTRSGSRTRSASSRRGVSGADLAMICGGNAARLLGIH